MFYGCSENLQTAQESNKIKIVVTIFPQYDFIREIAKDKVDLTMLLHPGAESHSFEPTPADIIKIKNCDVFIYVGGESDEWVRKILNSMDTSGKKVISLMSLVKPVEEEVVEGMQEDEDEHDKADGEPEYDEHIWTSPKNAKQIVKALSKILIERDSSNAQFYKNNLNEYMQKLNELDGVFEKIVKDAKRKTLVFGDRFPFRYFADAYGLKYFAAFPGCSSETEASAATIAFLIDKVKGEKIPAVFHIEFSNEKIADAICEQTGAKKLFMHSCHNVSKDDFQSGVSYFSLMSQNANNLKEALQ
jgi:zinc transport system substrate-binding protein